MCAIPKDLPNLEGEMSIRDFGASLVPVSQHGQPCFYFSPGLQRGQTYAQLAQQSILLHRTLCTASPLPNV